MFLRDKSLVAARQPSREFTCFFKRPSPPDRPLAVDPFASATTREARATATINEQHSRCVRAYVCIQVNEAYVRRAYYTAHSGAPELLRAAKPHLPPSISNRLPSAVCYIIKNRRRFKTRSRAFAARTLSAVTLRHCLDNNAPRRSNCRAVSNVWLRRTTSWRN